jgi:2-hydroxychromene-2-carboxylate isomerase
MKPGFPFPVLALSLALIAGCSGDAGTGAQKKQPENSVTEKVKIDMHIMSKCTWSAKVLTTLFPILDKMGDNIILNLHYIAREEKGEWKTIHGESEISGNTIQLCVKKHADSDKKWISFLKCQVKGWSKIPAGWEKCAETARIDAGTIQKCAEGDEGKTLLEDSFKYSQDKGAKGSPTIFLGGEPYTGGRTEASFRRAICDKFTGTKPEYCQNIPEPTKVPVTVITDKRCEGRACNPRRFMAFVRSAFEGAEIRTFDYSEPEGQKMFEHSGQKYLPVAIFGASIEKVENGYARLKRHLVRLEKTGEFIYPLGDIGKPPWDPKAEICNDHIDNTGNGKVDCKDESCNGKKVCREEITGRLDLFVMSHCHYGVRTVNAMAPVLEHFDKDRGSMDFNLQFIGKIEGEKLTALHGPREVAENRRQICAQKYYPNDYKFMEYVLCRNEHFQKNSGREEDNAWEECARDGISAAVLKKCAESEEGESLLAQSYNLADSLGLTGSPSWLLNNRYDMRARSPIQIRDEFCAKNAGNPKCDKPMNRDEVTPPSPVPDDSCNGASPPIRKKFNSDVPEATYSDTDSAPI